MQYAGRMRAAVAVATLFIGLAISAAETFDQYVSDIRILQAKPVQKELALTEAQRTKMNQAAQRNRDFLQTLDNKYRGQKVTPEVQKEIQPQIARQFQKLKVEVLAALTPAQTKRLGEITLQRAAWTGLADERVAKEAGLTPAQTKQVRSILETGGGKAMAVSQAAINPVLKKYEGVKPKDEAEAKALREKAQKEVMAARRSVDSQVNRIQDETIKKLKAAVPATALAKYQKMQGKTFRVK